ncbi:MAG: UvrD-helicase domain-containing protein [Candidatus Omnitrophota bacterium]
MPHSQIHIVEASAGSGKTYCLAQRYLKLILDDSLRSDKVNLSEILAITFTNKASSEMKERILDLLKKLSLGVFVSSSEKESLLELFNQDEEKLRKKATFILDYLVKHYNFFQVQTIDSFINAMLSSCAFKMGLSSSFKIRTDYSRYLSFSLDKLVERANLDKEAKEKLHNFLRQYLYIENRTGWFVRRDILTQITELYKKNNKYGQMFLLSDIDPKDLIIKKNSILKSLRQLKDELPQEANATFLKSLAIFLNESRNSFDVDELSVFLSHREVPINKGVKVLESIERLWNKIKCDIHDLCEMESVCVFNAYIDIFSESIKDLKQLSSREDVLFLEAMNKEARALFSEEGVSVPELYYRLATRFRHFLIDEFQDTSMLQWRNLYPMILEALSTGGSFFYVGDKKQAIYRFRGGEVTLMNEAKNELRQYPISSENLLKNFRSQKQIVEFNNNIFSAQNLRVFLENNDKPRRFSVDLKESDREDITLIFSASLQTCKDEHNGGHVSIEPIEAETSSERKEEVRDRLFTLLEDLKTRYHFKDIALLARENDEVVLITEWLLEKDIPVESEKTLNVRENSYIKEVISLLKFLNSPIDNLSFSSFILGEIFLSATGLIKEEIQDFIFSLKNKDPLSYTYREFRHKYPDVWEEYFNSFFKNVGFVPLYELLVSILQRFDVLKNFNPYQGFFMKLLELIKKQEEQEPGVAAFLEYFQEAPDIELYVNITHSDCLSVLTIHKAKGLEFPVVIIPFLEMNIKFDSQVAYPEEEGIRLLRLKKQYSLFSKRLNQAYNQQYKLALIDELNSIYVAFTRAAMELYVFVSPKGKKGVNPAYYLFRQISYSSGKKMSLLKEADKKESVIKIPASQYRDLIALLKDEFIEPGILRQRKKLKKGEVLHYLLSLIGCLDKQDMDDLLEEAVQKARVKFDFVTDFTDYIRIIRGVLRDRELFRFFSSADFQAFQEKEIVDCFGNTSRIDRLLIGHKEAIVIDYKSAGEESLGYQEQVKGYMNIIRDIYPKLKVRGYLLYLKDLKLQEIDG